MECPNCGSTNVSVQIIEKGQETKRKGIGLGGHVNNAARRHGRRHPRDVEPALEEVRGPQQDEDEEHDRGRVPGVRQHLAPERQEDDQVAPWRGARARAA